MPSDPVIMAWAAAAPMLESSSWLDVLWKVPLGVMCICVIVEFVREWRRGY